MLATTAFFWAVSDRKSLTDRFGRTRKISKKIFCRQPKPGKTYQGFIKALQKWHVDLIIVVIELLRIKIQWERDYRVAGHTLFAVDGSRVGTPQEILLTWRPAPRASRI